MKGLILKDLLNLKKLGLVIVLFGVFYGAFSVSTGNYAMFGFIMVLYGIMIPIQALAYDERANWDKYALSMPISRKDMVISKYLLGYLSAISAFIIFLVFAFVTGAKIDREMLLMCSAFFAGSILIESFILPLFFKFGCEKGRIIMMAVFFIPTAILLLLQKISIPKPSEEVLQKIAAVFERIADILPLLAVILILVAVLLSISTSLRIYNKKEL